MTCTTVQRAFRHFVPILLLLLTILQSTLAEQDLHHDAFEGVDGVEQLAELSETHDAQLRRAYMALMSMFSDATREAATRYGAIELRMLSNELESHIHTVNSNTDRQHRLDLKRSTPDDNDNNGDGEPEGILARLFAGPSPDSESESDTGRPDRDATSTGDPKEPNFSSATTLGKRLFGGLFGDVLGGGAGKADGGDEAGGAGAGAGGGKGGIGGIISNVAGDVVGKLLSSTGSGFAGAGFFGGVGAGQGAAQALNLATAARSKTTGEQVAQENGMKNSGLNPIIANAAMGLTATAVKAAMDSPLLKNLPPIAALAASLGAGVGSGGAMGLGITNKNVAPPLNGSSIEDIVGGLGFGASRALTSNLNLTGGLASLLPPVDIGATVQGVGNGIGKGAALGLKLTRNASVEPPPPASLQDIPGLAGTLSFGLSRSLTDSIDVGNLAAGLVPGNLDIGASVLSLASGLGGGAAQGLGLSAQNKSMAPPSPKSIADIPGIAGTLGFGLSNSFTSGADISAQSLGGLLPTFNFGDAALSVGSGVGKGAALGLKFTNDTSIAPPMPQMAQDIPGLAGTAAFGLSRSFTDALGQMSLGDLVPANLDVGGLALSAGTGIGNGAARGLKLSKADLGPPQPKSNADLPGIAGTFAFGLSNSLTDNLNLSAQSLGAAIPPIDFNSAALSVGNGIGSGAAMGLKLAQSDTNGFETPAPPSTPSLADIPRIAGTLAFGVSKSLTGSINASSMSVSDLIPADLDIGALALGAGRGLGGGASMGLGLASMTTPQRRAVSNSSSSPDVPGLVEKFTFGLGNSFTDKINIASQAQKLTSNLPPVDIGATVLSVGSALGLGSARGLGLAKADAQPPPMPASLSDIPGVAGTFSFGLSDALTRSLNTSGLLGGLTQNAGGMLAKFAAPLASGLGKGIGQGSAVGLGLQPESNVASPQDENIDAEALAQSFAEGLTSRFLANDTAGKLLQSVSGGNGTGGVMDLFGKIDVPRIANGLARGLLTGAGDGVEAVGGINAIINGTSAAPAGPIQDTKIEFDDSTGGAVLGFGQGLGASGVVTLQKLLARGINLRRSLHRGGAGDDAGDPKTRDLVVARQQENAPSPLNLTRLVSAQALSTVGQKGIDLLTCDGIAGAVLLLLGLQKSGTLPTGGIGNNTVDSVKTLIPRGVIRVESQGSTFEIDGTILADTLGEKDFDVFAILTINGSGLKKYATFLALHIVTAILGLYVVWPLVLTLGSLQNMAIRLRIPLLISAWTPRTTMILRLFVVAPFLIFILVFGVLSGAAAGHFRTAHGILGLVTLLVAIAAIALSFLAKPAELTPGDPVTGNAKLGTFSWASHACNQVLLALLLPTAITGFADLSSVTLCLTRAVATFELAVSLGTGIVFVYALGMYMSSAELILVFMANRRARKQKLVEKNRNNGNLGGDQGE